MKILEQIANFCKSLAGIISLSVMLVSVGSGLMLRHNAKILMSFVKQNKSLSGHEVDSIFTLKIAPVEFQIASFRQAVDIKHYNDSVTASVDRQEMTVVKSSLTDYWRAKKEFDEVVNFQAKLLDALKKNE